ncbi:hypothetical protein GQ53DRAFT_743121 [Thozetella sp. PMI_491]|nr:hypothetical protein GQ53DRAFT_743121 [Thozetella sp. PMI_491]
MKINRLLSLAIYGATAVVATPIPTIKTVIVPGGSSIILPTGKAVNIPIDSHLIVNALGKRSPSTTVDEVSEGDYVFYEDYTGTEK